MPKTTVLISVLLGLGVVDLLFFGSLVLPRDVAVSRLESISGIDFPVSEDGTLVQEQLAHADVSIAKPVLGQSLELTLTFAPYDLEKLEVGVRENSFWLSYGSRQELYRRDANTTPPETVTHVISIPLTDKLQEADQSLDLMFWATTKEEQPFEGERVADTTLWQLQELTATTSLTTPTWLQTKDYLRSIVKRERAL